MLARLQQIATLGALGLALLWGVMCWRSGQPAWAIAGSMLIVGGYALVLGLEFLLLFRVHGDDPTPRASAAQLLRAWSGEVVAAPTVFCWRQPFVSQVHPDYLPTDAGAQRGVLLVHGLVCNRGLWNRWLSRLARQGTPFVAVNLEPVFGSIDDGMEIIEQAMRQLEQCTGRAPVIVAHSMGGLSVRRWWAERGDDTRVHRLITLGTPHQGTWLARFATSFNARQMRPGSAWLRTLVGREPASRGSRITCFYGHCDNIVFPPRCGVMPGAAEHHLQGVAHVHMVDHPAPWQELQRWLAPG
jgi:pimeloyl-ACP methyl ester carboxylesterase